MHIIFLNLTLIYVSTSKAKYHHKKKMCTSKTCSSRFKITLNLERCNSIDQVLGLLLKNHQFESHKL